VSREALLQTVPTLLHEEGVEEGDIGEGVAGIHLVVIVVVRVVVVGGGGGGRGEHCGKGEHV